MTLFIKLSTDDQLIVEGENIEKFYKQFATGAAFIQVTALDLEDWNYNEEPSLYTINTKHIVAFNEETD